MSNYVIDSLEKLKNYIKDVEVHGKEPEVQEALFTRHNSSKSALGLLAKVEDGKLKGSKLEKYSEIESIIKNNEMLNDMVSSFNSGGSGHFEKTLEKNKTKLKNNFQRLVHDVDSIYTKIEKAEVNLAKDAEDAAKAISRAYEEQLKHIGENATKKAELEERLQKAMSAVTMGREKEQEAIINLKTELDFMLKGVEKETGLVAAEFRSGAKAAEAGKAGEVLKTAEEAGKTPFWKSKTTLVAAIAGGAGLLLGGMLLGGKGGQSQDYAGRA